jgi:hypothetical protein
MKKFTVLFTLLASTLWSQTGPWQSPLLICTSVNGTTFGAPTLFQDSSGVPTVIRLGTLSSDTLLAAFQWFPAPKFSTYWDKTAVKFSYNGGTTWTAPKSCTFTSMPAGFQRPFDPSLMQLANGQIRLYYSCGPTTSTIGDINTYSALSNDGITYTFEPTARFDDATKNAIDPSVVNFAGSYFYNSWTGTPSDGAFRATSNNALTFTTQATSTYDGTHLWLGNYMTDGSLLKFYGCGMNIWVNSSTNGTTWNTYSVTNVGMGADPAVVKNKSGTYVMLYTGPPAVTSVKDNKEFDSKINLFPTVFNTHFTITVSDMNERLTVTVFDQQGKKVHSSVIDGSSEKNQINLSHLAAGSYYCEISDGYRSVSRQIIKAE